MEHEDMRSKVESCQYGNLWRY